MKGGVSKSLATGDELDGELASTSSLCAAASTTAAASKRAAEGDAGTPPNKNTDQHTAAAYKALKELAGNRAVCWNGEAWLPFSMGDEDPSTIILEEVPADKMLSRSFKWETKSWHSAGSQGLLCCQAV
eukprot:14142-Heterococcus_DN1.PRE.4